MYGPAPSVPLPSVDACAIAFGEPMKPNISASESRYGTREFGADRCRSTVHVPTVSTLFNFRLPVMYPLTVKYA